MHRFGCKQNKPVKNVELFPTVTMGQTFYTIKVPVMLSSYLNLRKVKASECFSGDGLRCLCGAIAAAGSFLFLSLDKQRKKKKNRTSKGPPETNECFTV